MALRRSTVSACQSAAPSRSTAGGVPTASSSFQAEVLNFQEHLYNYWRDAAQLLSLGVTQLSESLVPFAFQLMMRSGRWRTVATLRCPWTLAACSCWPTPWTTPRAHWKTCLRKPLSGASSAACSCGETCRRGRPTYPSPATWRTSTSASSPG
ncbi:uncharacterized protein LOC126210381 isoform X2 [Schistocerca nitens]|uniref:uncharacterized protein LOC126210381 isoform X2 n=1 Tax=Schistocerca nitens TaxID=7011 RepID=UPI0021180575|nr:uncharacterized protein LOC126210381 isoform X2 [Schistocerca nitens]